MAQLGTLTGMLYDEKFKEAIQKTLMAESISLLNDAMRRRPFYTGPARYCGDVEFVVPKARKSKPEALPSMRAIDFGMA
jgi:hypothetical protein